MVPGAAGAGLSLLDERGRKTTAAATDSVVEHLDGLQYELGEGPCLTAWENRRAVRVDDISREKRWRRWTSAVRWSAMGTVVSVPLVAGDAAIGAIKVYGREPGAFGERDQYLLTMFAAQAAILVVNVRSLDNAQRLSEALAEQLRGRDVISMAKGIVMAREHVDEGTAFAVLARASHEENSKLCDLAGTPVRSTARHER